MTQSGFRNVLHLSYRDYRAVPEELRECSDEIDEIYLKENLIRYFPDWFFDELAHLRFLCLAGNVIDTLPTQLGRLQCLETLDLSDNSLQQLPHTIGQLGRLTKLLLNGNWLVQLPSELGRLHSLEVLEVRKNRLTAVPVAIGRCTALQDLLLDDNRTLVSIPMRLFNLPHLCYVSAERCNLFQLPFAINTTSLRFVLLFSGNHSLTHCPLQLERFTQPDYEALDERLRRIRNPSCYRQVRCPSVPYRLNFPSELVRLRARGDPRRGTPRSLLEQALCACSGAMPNGAEEPALAKVSLPRPLATALLAGPIARCSSVPCARPLFTEAILLLAKRKGYARNFPLSALFCSERCTDRWHQYNCDTYEEFPWTLHVP
ncbi:leucine-rich repeat-containing protein 1-like [Anopheles bellator]|uniref:leucine-rich repeat-containing protein 1-like n=1 Tax=Anopheles bellator TaxID=139047 RepID=UPI002648919E|nr:leucine-rich repeat-containing protein 1-like [Anopheles bellator]